MNVNEGQPITDSDITDSDITYDKANSIMKVTMNEFRKINFTRDQIHDFSESGKLFFSNNKDYDIFLLLNQHFWNEENLEFEEVHKNNGPATFIHEQHKVTYDKLIDDGKCFFGVIKNLSQYDSSEVNYTEKRHCIIPVFDLFNKSSVFVYENLTESLNWDAALELNKPDNRGLDIYGSINYSLLLSNEQLQLHSDNLSNMQYLENNKLTSINLISTDAAKKAKDSLRGAWQDSQLGQFDKYMDLYTTSNACDEASQMIWQLNNDNIGFSGAGRNLINNEDGKLFEKPIKVDFVEGDETFDETNINAMVGTYWYDPIQFALDCKQSRITQQINYYKS